MKKKNSVANYSAAEIKPPDLQKSRTSKQLKQALKELLNGDVLHYKSPKAFFSKYNL